MNNFQSLQKISISTIVSLFLWTIAIGSEPVLAAVNQTADSVNGACGIAHGTTVNAAPAANLCTSGKATAVKETPGTKSLWAWTCTGIAGGASARCGTNSSHKC